MALLDAFRNRRWLRTATSDPTTGSDSKAFLDKVGLATFWGKIKTWCNDTFATKSEVEAAQTAADAAQATADANTTALASKANTSDLNNYVKTTGVQTIGGTKTFSNRAVFNGGAVFVGTAAAGGLKTRGVCGSSSDGGTNDALWLNYEGDENYARKVYLGGQTDNAIAVRKDMLTWGNLKSKPTTISGYGITDAKIADGTITLGSSSITPATSDDITSLDSQISGLENQVSNNYIDLSAEIEKKQDKLTIDSSLNTSSTNPVQNKVVAAALQNKQDKLTIDTALSTTSSNPVQNKAITEGINSVMETIDDLIGSIPTTDSALSEKSTNPVQNKVVTAAINAKADKVTYAEMDASSADGIDLDPYTHYVIPNFDSNYYWFTINSYPTSGEDFLKPCFVQFYVESESDFIFTYPSTLKWANGEVPTFEQAWYQLSIVGGCAVCTKFDTV